MKRILGERDESLRAGDIALLSDIAQAMRDASICGLGQTAASAIGSAMTQLKIVGGGSPN